MEVVSMSKETSNAKHRRGAIRSSDESSVMGLERRGCVVQLLTKEQPEKGMILMEKEKSITTSKRQALEAYKHIYPLGYFV